MEDAHATTAQQKTRIFFITKKQLIIAVVLLGIAFLILIVLLFLWFPQVWPELAQVAPILQPTSAILTLFILTPDCGPPTLVLGSTTYQIQNLAPAPDGSLTLPSDTPGIAYWLEGTDNHYVFVLSPTPNNLALQTALTTGDLATALWADCTTISSISQLLR